MAIVQQDDLKLLLGLSTSITDEEQAFLSLLHPLAEGVVKAWIGYDPEQKNHTQLFPRHLRSGGPGFYDQEELLSVTSTHVMFGTRSGTRTLQLHHIPIRSITSVKADTAAYHGDADDAFGDGTEYTLAEDYHVDWDQTKVCLSGQLFDDSGWLDEPGTIQVVYRAGYSPAELSGTATEDAVEGDLITTAGVDASGITMAVHSTLYAAFTRSMNMKKKTAAGWTTGPLTGERMQDYSYTVDTSLTTSGGVGGVTLTDDAKRLLEPFKHWGLARL